MTGATIPAECNCAARFYGDDRSAHQLCCAALAGQPSPAAVDQQEAVEAADIARRIVREFRGKSWPAKEDEIARLILRHFTIRSAATHQPATDTSDDLRARIAAFLLDLNDVRRSQEYADGAQDLAAVVEGAFSPLTSVREALKQAEVALASYADPAGYTDQYGDPYTPDDNPHPGMLAADTLVVVRAALAQGGEVKA